MNKQIPFSGKTIKKWKDLAKEYQVWLDAPIWTINHLSAREDNDLTKHWMTYSEALDYLSSHSCKNCQIAAKNGGEWCSKSGTFEGDLDDWFETPDILATACGSEFSIELSTEFVCFELEYVYDSLMESDDIEFVKNQIKQIRSLWK